MKKVIFITCYIGHPQGKEEALWIDNYVSDLDTHTYNVSSFKMMNKKNKILCDRNREEIIVKYKALIFDIDNTLVNTLDMNMIPYRRLSRKKRKNGFLEEVYHFALISRYEGHGRTRSQ